MKNTPFYILFLLLLSCSTQKKSLNASFADAFDESQKEMIMNADKDSPMRVFKITNHSDSLLLRQKSDYVDPNSSDTAIDHFISRLYATVRDSMSLGVGIAAPQVGILKNIIWVQRFDKEGFPFEVYLNPKILQYSQKKQTRAEGCLSIPDRRETLDCRAYAILIEYDRQDGTHGIEMVEDFTAIIFQHEIDHLNGIMYIDHLNSELEKDKK